MLYTHAQIIRIRILTVSVSISVNANITCSSIEGLGLGASNMSKLYVGNVPEGAKDKELQELFEAFGEVEEVAMLRGYGFVVSGAVLCLVSRSCMHPLVCRRRDLSN